MSSNFGKAWVIERDLNHQHFVTSYLSTIGYTTRSFSSGEECLKNLAEKPDLIILDHNHCGDLDGVEVLKKIRTECPETPVINISGQQKLSLIAKPYRSGSKDYINKSDASLGLKARFGSTIKEKKSYNLHRKIKGILLFVALCLSLLLLFMVTRTL